MDCTKRTFRSRKSADGVALKLNLENEKIGHPLLKYYKCSICGKFHLTSDRKNKTNKQDINLKRERDFIKKESEYWENYFNK